jgi:site-specific DNA recombinase
MKAIIFARVSTDDQREANNSLPAQIVRMEDYCNRRNFEIIQRYSFSESAYKDKRDEFDKTLRYVESTKEKIAICFDKVDRLSRNIFDKRVALLYEKAIADEIELHFVSDGQIINNSMNAGDKFAFGMKLGLSKYYSDAIGDNVKRTFEQKRKNGEWTGPVPLGYVGIPANKNKRTRRDIIIDPEKGPLVKKMFELYAIGDHSIKTLRNKISELGLKSKKEKELSNSIVHFNLKNKFYCGTAVPRKYEPYPHKYPCLIDKGLFKKCQEVLLKRRKTPSKANLKKEYILGNGLLKCGHCGCAISFETKRKPSGKIYIIGSCTNAKGVCKREYVNEERLLEPIYKNLEKFGTIKEEAQKELVEELRKTTEAEIEFHKAQINRIRKEYEEIKAKDNRLLELFLDGNKSITKETYDKKHQEFQDKLQLLNIQLEEYTKADYDYQTTVSTVISIARRAREIFENCSEPSEKRAFLNLLLQNPTLKAKKLDFELASPFNLVLELADGPTWLRG